MAGNTRNPGGKVELPPINQPPITLPAIKSDYVDKPLELIPPSPEKDIIEKTLIPRHLHSSRVVIFFFSYLANRDVKQAAIEAGCTPENARRWGRATLAKKDVSEAVQAVSDSLLMRYGLDGHSLVRKISEVSEFDPIELKNPDGTFKTLEEMSPEARRCIKKLDYEIIWGKDPNGIKEEMGKIVKVEFYDKIKATEIIGRELRLFSQRTINEQDISKGMSDLLLQSKKLAEDRAKDVTPVLVRKFR